MSNLVGQEMLPELWDEIVKRHWTYFGTEESILKLENRKKLEDCLKKFLCIVQQDRKFFLTQTSEVLKNSIRDLENFDAHKAINAFESISQYANNLYTKPWRKEFRILKMYSGFYQHEIKSNLLGADKLFEEMGYRRLSDNIFILDDPICPDQVANVSRDAMTAYVELQIIKDIYEILHAIGVNCSWLEIFRHRENNIGSTSQAIEALANAVSKNNCDMQPYKYNMPSSNSFDLNTQFCSAQCQCKTYQQIVCSSKHRAIPHTNGLCCASEYHQPSLRTSSNVVYSNMDYPGQHNYHHESHNSGMLSGNGENALVQMSHSRSLEHYSEQAKNSHRNMLPYRHSFDHQQKGCTAQHQEQHYYSHQPQHHLSQHPHYCQPQQNIYESTYDCKDGISLGDGSSTMSYVDVAGNAAAINEVGGLKFNMKFNSTYSDPYNVSGNRFPLPYNISNQLSAYDNLHLSNCADAKEPTYGHIVDKHIYSTISKLPQNYVPNSNLSGNLNSCLYLGGSHVQDSHFDKDTGLRQRPFQNDYLISFDEQPIISPLIKKQFNVINQNQSSYDPSSHNTDKRKIINHMGYPGKTVLKKDTYEYAYPIPRENRKSVQNPIDITTSIYNSVERGDTTDMSYESISDHPRSPTQFKRDQEGIGSFENWNYVFQNVNKSGYSKGLEERENSLVAALGLDSLNISNDTLSYQRSSTEKKRSNNVETESKSDLQNRQRQQQTEHKQKSKTFENPKYLSKNKLKKDSLAPVPTLVIPLTNSVQKTKSSMDNNTKEIKSVSKHANLNSVSNSCSNLNPKRKTQLKTNNNVNTKNNNNNDPLKISSNIGTTTQRKSSNAIENLTMNSSVGITTTTTKTASNTTSLPLSSMQSITTNPNEWSCAHCTLINPNTNRICEVCYKSKDFNLDSSTTSTAVGTPSVARNTPTCA